MAIDFPNSPSVNDVYSADERSWRWDGTTWRLLTGLLTATLDDLTNVTAPSPSDGQFLKYVSASTAWVPAAIPTINNLDDVGDVTITSATSGDYLRWNGSTWINDPINLGTDTTGNYVSDVVAGNLITVTHTPGEGSSASVAVASGTAGQIIVANASGVPTWVSESGDVTIDSSGVAAISSGVIVNADINSSAAIALTKLASDTTTALGVGTVELGHATDTTLARGSAGRLTVEGVNVVTTSSTDTLTNKTISSGVLTGSLTAGGSAGTNGQYLQSTGTGVAWASVSAGGVTSVNGQTGAVTGLATTSGTLAQFGATTSSQLAGVISDETGSGSLVFSASPALTGTPTAPTAASTTNSTQIATTAFAATLQRDALVRFYMEVI